MPKFRLFHEILQLDVRRDLLRVFLYFLDHFTDFTHERTSDVCSYLSVEVLEVVWWGRNSVVRNKELVWDWLRLSYLDPAFKSVSAPPLYDIRIFGTHSSCLKAMKKKKLCLMDSSFKCASWKKICGEASAQQARWHRKDFQWSLFYQQSFGQNIGVVVTQKTLFHYSEEMSWKYSSAGGFQNVLSPCNEYKKNYYSDDCYGTYSYSTW